MNTFLSRVLMLSGVHLQGGDYLRTKTELMVQKIIPLLNDFDLPPENCTTCKVESGRA